MKHWHFGCEGYSLIVGDDSSPHVYFLWVLFLFVLLICPPHFMLLQMQTSVSLTERQSDDEVNR